MSGWWEGPMLGFDLETTAPDPTEARIVTASLVMVGEGEPSGRSWLADPGVPIPDEAAAIHGVTTEKAQAEGWPIAEVLGELVAAFDAWSLGPTVAFNASYDFTVLHRELVRHDLDTAEDSWVSTIRPIVDPFVIDRHHDKYRRGKRTLGAMCEHYRCNLDGAHDATADAFGALRLAWRIPQALPEVAALSLDELHDRQAGWHAERQEDFAAYLRREGKDDSDVSSEWPLRAVQP